MLFDYRIHDPQNSNTNMDSVIDFTLNISGKAIPLGLGFKNCEGKLSQFVPLAHKISDIITDITLKSQNEKRCKISCRKGCSACCNYIIPLSSAEAVYLHDYTITLPDKTRKMIVRSFMLAAQKIASSQIPKLADKTIAQLDNLEGISQWYRQLQLQCPFLFANCCSIYNHRPLACREYFVTSPPKYCKPEASGNQATLILPFSIAEILMDVSNSIEDTSDEAIILPLTMFWYSMNKKRTEETFPTGQLAERFVQVLTAPKNLQKA